MRSGRRVRMLTVLLLIGFAFPLWHPAEAAPDRETQKVAALARVNQWRAAIGVPPMARHPALEAAAQSHAEYNARNPGHMHNETPGKPGFTGATMSDRTKAAGYPGNSVNENMGAYGDMQKSLDWFIGTINHRLPLIDPRYIHVGFGIANGMEIINMGAPAWSETSDPTWEQWPPADATGIATSFSGETPDAFSGARYPVGGPVTLKYLGAGGVQFTGATVTANGATVPSVAITGSGWITKNTYIVATTSPMQPGTDYRVALTGTANGAAFTRAWGFRTVTKGEPENAVAGAGAVAGGKTVAAAPTNATPAATTVPTATATAASTKSPVVPAAKYTARAMPVFPAAPAAPRGGFALPGGMTGMTGPMGIVGTTWAANDGAVATGSVTRSWLFGPDAVTTRTESYAEATGGKRGVVYFDKARMEVGNGGATVTNGLLVVEMTSGQVQMGDKTFRAAQPAAIPIAGDAAGNAECPTYATLAALANYGGNGRRAADRTGQPVVATLDAKGAVADDPARAGLAAARWYEPTLGHNVPDVFYGWLGSLPERWQTLVGLPITEPYWTTTRVDGKLRPVLMQAFERRVLTYTPDNPAAWQVEMGNVGAHYLRWRENQ